MSEDSGGPAEEQASEVRHRTANTLQLLATLARMRGQKASDAEVRRQMIWMAEAIGALGSLERRRTPEGIDFSGYIEEMAPVWRRRQAGDAVNVVIRVDPMHVRDQAASTLALIVNEMVANALTHGLRGAAVRQIEIELTHSDGMGRLCITDGGPGLGAAGENVRERFGLWLARSLATQVRGELALLPVPGGGLTAQLIFPL
ncbi:MAG: sensor histidine kinase [Phenylobacterium sp.]|nr:sensor histidine kinase [Phenylobacterium sp.]